MSPAEFRKLLEASTPGPWYIGAAGRHVMTDANGAVLDLVASCAMVQGPSTSEGNAAAIVFIRNHAALFADLWEAAKGTDPQCRSPISDSEGDGVWCIFVQLDCGECEACQLSAVIAALEAAKP